MADVFSKEQRSQIMRQVKRNLNKSTELRLIRFFKLNFITGWRRNYKIYGKPDFVFPKKRLAVFVDGCFWHGHNCRNTKPKNNKNYWDNKIKKNIERDISVSNILESKGWKVLRIWECQLKEHELLINFFGC